MITIHQRNSVFPAAACAQAVYSYKSVPEQKARATYDNLISMTNNPQIVEPLLFLREREIVHYQRFGECLEIVQSLQSVKNCGCSRCNCTRTRARR